MVGPGVRSAGVRRRGLPGGLECGVQVGTGLRWHRPESFARRAPRPRPSPERVGHGEAGLSPGVTVGAHTHPGTAAQAPPSPVPPQARSLVCPSRVEKQLPAGEDGLPAVTQAPVCPGERPTGGPVPGPSLSLFTVLTGLLTVAVPGPQERPSSPACAPPAACSRPPAPQLPTLEVHAGPPGPGAALPHGTWQLPPTGLVLGREQSPQGQGGQDTAFLDVGTQAGTRGPPEGVHLSICPRVPAGPPACLLGMTLCVTFPGGPPSIAVGDQSRL